MDKELFISEVKKLGVLINNEQLDKLDKYYHLLVEWNEKINLTRITEEKDVYLKHFYDSITLSRVYNLYQNVSLCDIGTGAGFPGIVLKIVFPSLNITLVDSLLKRINFLNEVIKELELNNIKTVHARAEDYAKIHCNEFDIVTCRAVSNLKNLLGYSIPLINKNGCFIPMKGNAKEEISISAKKLKKLHCAITQIDEFKLPIENSVRTLIVIKRL